MYRDTGDEENLNNQNEDNEEGEGGIDPDAFAFIKAKRKVDDLHRAKKQEKKGVY
jgi:hypothetical protein